MSIVFSARILCTRRTSETGRLESLDSRDYSTGLFIFLCRVLASDATAVVVADVCSPAIVIACWLPVIRIKGCMYDKMRTPRTFLSMRGLLSHVDSKFLTKSGTDDVSIVSFSTTSDHNHSVNSDTLIIASLYPSSFCMTRIESSPSSIFIRYHQRSQSSRSNNELTDRTSIT